MSRVNPSRRAVAAALVMAASSVLVLVPTAQARSGDLVVAQFGDNAPPPPKITRVKPKSGHLRTIAKGAPLTAASYLTYRPSGKLAVTDERLAGGIFNVNPATGGIHELGLSGVTIEAPYGIDTDPQGNLIVADYNATQVVRVNRTTTDVETITSGPWLGVPYGLAVDHHSGTIFVADDGGAVDRLSPTGDLPPVASGEPFSEPWGIARAPGGMLYVTDVGNETLFRVDPKTEDVDPVASIGGDSYGVVAASKRVVYTTSFDDGTVSRINVTTGHVRPVTSDLVQPIGITIQP